MWFALVALLAVAAMTDGSGAVTTSLLWLSGILSGCLAIVWALGVALDRRHSDELPPLPDEMTSPSYVPNPTPEWAAFCAYLRKKREIELLRRGGAI